jgi:uncharacterized protein YigE (DUF2233 family)
MSSMLRAVAALGLTVAVAASALGAARFGWSTDALAVREAKGWVTWWRKDSAPVHWDGRALLAKRIVWKPGAPGVDWGTLQLRGANEAWRTRVIVVRVDPHQVDFLLTASFAKNESWTVARADSSAVLALSAGQFRGSLPWGWVVTKGRELLPAEYAPLAGAVVVDTSGALSIVRPEEVASVRARGGVREAFQSYPMLLQNGAVPEPLQEPGRDMDLNHRDSRLGLGTLPDGRVIVALTRFDALGESFGRVPFGLTAPEMIAVMGALGSRDAIMLDGGISSQLMLRDRGGTARSWPGTRRVPLGVTALPRRAH